MNKWELRRNQTCSAHKTNKPLRRIMGEKKNKQYLNHPGKKQKNYR
jgi:hypothetical protein